MKTLLLAAFALTLALPAWAQIATTTTTVQTDGIGANIVSPTAQITTDAAGNTAIVTPTTTITTTGAGANIATTTPVITYEQAFTSCTETTAAVAGDKKTAVESCMTEKGFTVKDETTTTTGTTSTTTEVKTEVAQ